MENQLGPLENKEKKAQEIIDVYTQLIKNSSKDESTRRVISQALFEHTGDEDSAVRVFRGELPADAGIEYALSILHNEGEYLKSKTFFSGLGRVLYNLVSNSDNKVTYKGKAIARQSSQDSVDISELDEKLYQLLSVDA